LVAAHEVGHGLFQLRHTFDYSGIKQGALPDNLMDYSAGNQLSKLQWDLIHDPGLVFGLFETDKGGQSSVIKASKLLDWIKANLGKIDADYKKNDFFENKAIVDVPLYVSGTNKETIKLYAELGHSGKLNLYKNQKEGVSGIRVSFDLGNLKHTGFNLSFTYSDNAENDNFAIRLWCYSYEDFEKLLKYLNLEITTKRKKDIENQYIDIINSSAENCNMLDVIFETIPDFVSVSTDKLLKSFDKLTSCKIDKYLTNEEQAVLNILKRFNDNKVLYEHLKDKNIYDYLLKMTDTLQLKLISRISTYYTTNVLKASRPFQINTLPLKTHYIRSEEIPQLSYPTYPIFKWNNTELLNTIYHVEIASNGKFNVSQKLGTWFVRDYDFLMYLDTFELVGIVLSDKNKYFPNNNEGDVVVLTAMEFYWITNQQEQDIAWKNLISTADIALNVATMGIYGETKTALQVATQITITATFDYALQIAINSIGANSLDDAVKASSFGDAVWSGVNSLVDNAKMGVTLDCVRNLLIKEFSDEELLMCGTNALLTFLNNKYLFAENGKYAKLLANQFRRYPKVTIAKLRKWGITDSSIMAITETVLTNGELNLINRIKELLKNEK
jgi:hypothetical protein